MQLNLNDLVIARAFIERSLTK